MGCDFSVLVKQDFTDKHSRLQKSVQKIRKKQERLEKFISQFKSQNPPQLETRRISFNLCGQLEQLGSFLNNVRSVRESPSMSLSSSSSNEEAPKPPMTSEMKDKAQNSNHVLAKTGQNAKLFTTESILEDPEVMALITKNRQRLFKKLTK